MANEKRLIDANALKNEMLEENPYIYFAPFGYCACSPKTDGELVFKREDVLRAIDSAPIVDAVEVVRCKDCRYYDKDALWCDISSPIFHPEHYNWYEEDFCSYGERKTDGKE